MPNLVSYTLDRHLPQRTASAREPSTEPALPGSWFEAIFRGARNICPRCGGNPLFGRFLKPLPACFNCGQDWSLQSADDFPAYLSILITGHLVVPLIITLTNEFDLSAAVFTATILPLTALLVVVFLQPAKGAVIATQWWLGMNGFKVERPEVRDRDEDLPPEPAKAEAPPSPRDPCSFNSLEGGSLESCLDDARADEPKPRVHVSEPAAVQPCNAKFFGCDRDSLH
jgi:uncharacterized protein (DUF983 family)